jgi:hypothetical protein
MIRSSLIDRIHAEAHALRLRFGVADLAVIGSVARGEAGEGKDIDVLVTFEGTADFDRFMGLKIHLEGLLGRPVDLVTPKALRPELRLHIEREAVRVT